MVTIDNQVKFISQASESWTQTNHGDKKVCYFLQFKSLLAYCCMQQAIGNRVIFQIMF